VAVLEESGCRVSVSTLGRLLHLFDDALVDCYSCHGLFDFVSHGAWVWGDVKTDLHHAQMLTAVMRLEECIAGPAFHENAAK
jgi:hypothetical protein